MPVQTETVDILTNPEIIERVAVEYHDFDGDDYTMKWGKCKSNYRGSVRKTVRQVLESARRAGLVVGLSTPAVQPASGLLAEAETIARAIDPEWWKWADVHFDDSIPGDRMQKQASLDRAARAMSALAAPAQPESHAVPDEYVGVPRKMTAAMINAWSGGLTVTSDEIAYNTTFQDAWSRVLSAVPSAQPAALVTHAGGEERKCQDCAGTGDEYGSVFPEGFFDDQFEGTRDEDSVLQAAAREAGWALSSLVDEIKFEKRQQVVNIINRLSAALAYSTPHAAPQPVEAQTQEKVVVTDEMVEAGLQHYSEGGCAGLADYERREVVRAILEAALHGSEKGEA